jgi:hypothetical protein
MFRHVDDHVEVAGFTGCPRVVPLVSKFELLTRSDAFWDANFEVFYVLDTPGPPTCATLFDRYHAGAIAVGTLGAK